MYGAEPGKERNQGVMNQHVVTKLTRHGTKYSAFWILHTRGENAVSILIATLRDMKAPPDVINDCVRTIVLEHQLTEREWNAIADQDGDVFEWGSETKLVKLHIAVAAAKTSSVVGYEKASD